MAVPGDDIIVAAHQQDKAARLGIGLEIEKAGLATDADRLLRCTGVS
jgi:hypothetical protein